MITTEEDIQGMITMTDKGLIDIHHNSSHVLVQENDMQITVQMTILLLGTETGEIQDQTIGTDTMTTQEEETIDLLHHDTQRTTHPGHDHL